MQHSTHLFLIIALAGALSATAPAFSQNGTHEIILISTNDVHGRIDNFSRMAAYVKTLKKDHPDVFVLNAGDLINGNPVVDEAKEKGYPMIDIMNDIPYDVSCPGNHEFENGEEILSQRIGQSTSIYLAANMKVDDQSPIRPLKPYTLLHASDGTSLTILGLTTNSSNPCLIHHVSISDPVRTALEFKGLRNDSTIFIALTHIGYTRDSVLATNMKELDVIIGGHSHTEIPHGLLVNGVLITQTGDKLRYIGKTVLTVKDHKVIGKTFEMIDLSQLTDKDPAIQAKIDSYDRNNSFGETVGASATGFKNKEELGDLKADAIAEILHLDIAFDHPRNISFSNLPKGNISRGDIYQMDPYDYKIIRYELTPADIRSLIARSLGKGKKQLLFVSGITYTLTADPSGEKPSVILKRPNGPLDEYKRYSVGVNSYIACQFMPGVDGGVQQNATSEDLLIRYLAIHKNVDYSNVKRIHLIPAAAKDTEKPRGKDTVVKSAGNDLAGKSAGNDTIGKPAGSNLAGKLRGKALPQLIRGPYLQVATTHSIIVRWRTDALTRGRVSYGEVPGKLDKFADDSALATEHIIQLDGLLPETRYYYSVGRFKDILQGDSNNYFRTLPVAGKAGFYRIGVFGDCGNNSVNQRLVRQAVLNYLGTNYMNAWILLGDNAYPDGTDAEFQAKFFNIYKEGLLKKFPLFPAPGNHDYHDIEFSAAVAQKTHEIAYYQDFSMPRNGESGGLPSHTNAFYSFDIGNVHFLSLDSYGKEENVYRMYDTLGPQVQWIKKDLETNTNRQWIIAYWHHPPYTMGSHSSDHEGDLVRIRENFIRVLERYGVDLILCGHSHDYERSSLMKGHYGKEETFSTAAYDLSTSSGRYDGAPNSCPYIKSSATGAGTVYVVSGSAGQLGGKQPGYPHNAMLYSNADIGGASMLEIRDNRLDLKWICSDGVIRDQFTLMKDVGKTNRIQLKKGESTLLTASFISDHYTWNKTSDTTRQLTVTPPEGKTIYQVKDGIGCLKDIFEVTVTR